MAKAILDAIEQLEIYTTNKVQEWKEIMQRPSNSEEQDRVATAVWETYRDMANRIADLGELVEKALRSEIAKADGRLVMLPCKEVYAKAGDTLYLIDGGEIIEVAHCGAEISPSGEIYVVVAAEDKIFPFRQPDPENDLDPTDWCTETKEVMLDDFGKTIFLTHEEAEEALKGAEHDRD